MSNTLVGAILPTVTQQTLSRLSAQRGVDETSDAACLAEIVVNQHGEDGHAGAPAVCYSAACQAAYAVLHGDPRSSNGQPRLW
jgi:hypothetical protein